MCLLVEYVPNTRSNGLIHKCWKLLIKAEALAQYRTAFRMTPVPKSGWLFPRHNFKRKIFLDQHIEGGLIHAYTRRTPSFWLKDEEEMFSAYAFGVEAWDNHIDLACRALYIPKLDTEGNLLEPQIKKLLQLRNKTGRLPLAKVVALHPRLPKILEVYQP